MAPKAKAKKVLSTAAPARRWWLLGLLLVALVVASWWLAHQPSLQIARVVVQGAKTVPAEQIAASANIALSGNYFFLYPKRHAWWYDAAAISARVQKDFPRLATVNLEQTAGNEITLTVTERAPAYLWCPVTDAHCYFMDQSGFVFGLAPEYSDHLFFEFSGAGGAGVGTRPLVADELEMIVTLRDELLSIFAKSDLFASAKIYRATAQGGGDYDLALGWPGASDQSSGSVIRLTAHNQADQVALALRSALGAAAFNRDWLAGQGALEYLDARFLPKIFYKFAD